MNNISQKRRKALQWFYDNGPCGLFGRDDPSDAMRRLMERDGQIEREKHTAPLQFVKFHLTDKGRRDLWESRK